MKKKKTSHNNLLSEEIIFNNKDHNYQNCNENANTGLQREQMHPAPTFKKQNEHNPQGVLEEK